MYWAHFCVCYLLRIQFYKMSLATKHVSGGQVLISQRAVLVDGPHRRAPFPASPSVRAINNQQVQLLFLNWNLKPDWLCSFSLSGLVYSMPGIPITKPETRKPSSSFTVHSLVKSWHLQLPPPHASFHDTNVFLILIFGKMGPSPHPSSHCYPSHQWDESGSCKAEPHFVPY